MLFGRSAERAHFEQLLDAAASGPAGCILEGIPGIGKTTLWRELVQEAHRRGYRVLETSPSEPESVLAFSGLSDLFDLLPDEIVDTLPDAQAHALRAALLLGELPESARDLQALPRAVLGVVRQVAADGPVLIAIDDEQWLDPASARVLSFALCRLREEPIAVILARRPDSGGMLSAELGRRFRGHGMETVSLAPLPMSTIKMLLEARLRRPISRPLLRRIHQAAGGNPLWALAIALEAQARHAGADRAGDLPIPRTLADAIELQLAHIDPRANEAMLAIAALSQPTPAMLQAAIPHFALSDLDSAERAGVIEISGGRLRFTHPLLASTHYAKAPASKRRELHRLLATVIDDEEERAQHVALGAEAPDGDTAAALEQAARVAARRGATESAAQLLEDAARLTPLEQEPALNARLVAAAEQRFVSGDVSRARAILEEVMPDLGTGPLRAKARLQLAQIRADEPRVGVELLEASLADVGEDDALRVDIESELATMAAGVGRLTDARAHAESAVTAAERAGDPDLRANALGQLLATFVFAGDPIRHDLLAELSAIGDPATMTTYRQPSTALGLALAGAGDADAARPLLERAAQRALARGEEWDRLGIVLQLAQLEWEAGNQQAAEQYRHAAEEAVGEFPEGGLWIVYWDATRALEKGDLTGARAKAEHGLALAERTEAVWHAVRLRPVLAAVELLSGRPELAHERLAPLREWLLSSGFGSAGAHRADIWSEDVEALIALGNLDEAGQVLAELQARAEVCQAGHVQALAARSEGLLLAARGDLTAAIGAVETALAAHMRSRRPYEHGRTLLEMGSMQRRARRKAAAKHTLQQALAMLEPLGAELWLTRTRDELDRIGLRPARASEGLTPAQARVAELVAAGLTNPQIARQLHMSLRTVESHLTQVYRQHGVTSRSQLARALVDR